MKQIWIGWLAGTNLKSELRNPKSAILVSAMLFVLCSSTAAQQTGKVARIGVLDTSTASSSAAQWQAFRHELSKLGWIEGKNIAFEYRFAEQKSERLPELAADLVGLKVDLIVVTAGPAAAMAKKATSTIPIVMTNAADPVGAGLIASLARPGANVTGLASLAPELNTKRLEISRTRSQGSPESDSFGYREAAEDKNCK